MERFTNTEELLRFERRWKIVFTSFALVFAGALLDHMVRSPSGEEALWCYGLGTVAFFGALFSAHKLRDAGRKAGVRGGLDLLAEDCSAGDLGD